MTPEEVEAATRPSQVTPISDSWLKDAPLIADHALDILDRLQNRQPLGPLKSSNEPPEPDHRIDLEDTKPCHCTHAGNGERFVLWFGNMVRYCPAFDWWYLWRKDEGRWARDEMGTIFELGKNVVKYLYLEAANAVNKEKRKELAIWAMKCETPGSVNQLLESARTDPCVAVHFDTFDIDPLHLNLKNGWLDMRTMEFHPHRKDKFFTMMIPVKYTPAATCPGWLAFLERIFKSNPEKEKIIEFIQRAIGYTLTGETSERAIFLMHGLGANGKTVFIRVLEALFGDYGTSVSSSTFTTAMATNVRNDLARLKGKRFVWASENSSETVLDEEMIKRASGGDTVVCRFLFKEEFEYRPNFKIWWVFNHKPKIRDATDSIWDRIHLVPCEERIPKDEQDKKLSEKLVAELPGILNWAIAGYMKYKDLGTLAPPSSVLQATKDYRSDEDILAGFIQECIEEIDQKSLSGFVDAREPFPEIWRAWSAWANSNNEKLRSKRWLGSKLSERYKQTRDPKTRYYIGIRLKVAS